MKRTACNGCCASRGFVGLAVWLAWCVAASIPVPRFSRAERLLRGGSGESGAPRCRRALDAREAGSTGDRIRHEQPVSVGGRSLSRGRDSVRGRLRETFAAPYPPDAGRRRGAHGFHVRRGGRQDTGDRRRSVRRGPERAPNGRAGPSFYGLGPNSARDSSLQYDYRTTTLTATVAFHPVRWVELSGTYEWLTLRSDLESPNPAAAALGFGEGLSYNVVTASATLDWRPSPSYSTRGGSHRLTWSQYLPTQDRPFQFHQLEYEGIQLVPILREQWVLALRVLTTLTTAEAGAVPAVLSPTLGGAETLRGYETRRFTDRNRLLVTGEYRWRPSRWIDLALFCDAGRVGARRQDLGLSNMETDWGVGLRGHGPRSAAFRIEGARGRGGWEAVFVVGSPQ